MDQMELHVAVLAVNRVLTRPMEVELLQFVRSAVQLEYVLALGLDLDRVPVVEDLSPGLFVLDGNWLPKKLARDEEFS